MTEKEKKIIREYKIGGVILYRKNYDSYEEMLKIIDIVEEKFPNLV